MMNFLKKNKKGFTLIELIVVIAILGILAAIIIPRVGQFRESANESHDRATLRTVQGAINMYHAQHGRWPGTGAGASEANYTALNNSLGLFLDLPEGAMPLARSGTPVRRFQYDPATGVVSLPGLPTN